MARRTDKDLVDEIQSHLQLETDRLIAEGMSPSDARAAAQRKFGRVTPVQEWFHESRRVLWLDHLVQDLKAAARSVAKYPISCFVAVISLAGGIGATTATLTIRDVIFLRAPLHYQSPEQLSVVQ